MPRWTAAQRKKIDFVEINMINVEKTVLPFVFCIAVPGIITETDDTFDCVDEPRVLEETKHCGPVCLSIHPMISVKHLKKNPIKFYFGISLLGGESPVLRQ